MSAIPFLASYIGVIIVILFAAWGAKHNFLEITIFNVFLFFALLLNFVGIPIVYFDLDAYQIQYIVDKSILINVYLFISATLLILFFTYIITSKYIENTLAVRLKPSAWKKETNYTTSLYAGGITFFLGIGGFLTYCFEIGFSNLPLFVSFTKVLPNKSVPVCCI